MKLDSKRFHYLMIGITALLGIGIFVSVYIGSGLLKKQSQKLLKLKTDGQVLDQQQTSLITAKKAIDKYSELNREARIIVPQDKDQAQVIREITKLAKKAKIGITSIQFQSSNLGLSKPTTGTTTPNNKATPTATPKVSPLTQTQAVPGIKGLYTMEIVVSNPDNATAVQYSNFIKFLGLLEQNRRTAHVNSININPHPKNKDLVNFTLTINAYIKPGQKS